MKNLKLEKLKIAKLTNLTAIKGGSENCGGGTQTNTNRPPTQNVLLCPSYTCP